MRRPPLILIVVFALLAAAATAAGAAALRGEESGAQAAAAPAQGPASPPTSKAAGGAAQAAPAAAAPVEAGLTDAARWLDALSKRSLREGWALPPKIILAPKPAPGADAAGLRAEVGARRDIVLAPPARGALARATRADLALLAALPKGATPHLVWSIAPRAVAVQETTLAATVSVVRDLVQQGAPISDLRLLNVPADFADAAKGYADASGPSSIGARAVKRALSQLGVPYVWGGASPHPGFDCSGLMMWAYAPLGVRLDHYAALQFLEGRRIAVADLQPGDMVFFEPKADGPGHVGMYIGGDMWVQAPHTGDVVRVTRLSPLLTAGYYVGAVRPY